MATAAQIPLRLAAMTVIILAGLVLLVSMYMCMTHPWIFKFLDEFSLASWYTSRGSQFGLFPPTVLDTFFSKQIMFTWLPLLFIALVTIWLQHPPFHSRARARCEVLDFSGLPSRQVSKYDSFVRQSKRLFHYQLPPRRLLSWIFDGGFNGIDLIVVALWISINALWLYFSWLLIWPTYVATFKETGVYTNGSRTADICDSLGYASAWAAVYNLVFVFIPIPRNSFLQYLFNSDFSSIIKYHRWLGHGALWMTLFHGVVFYIKWFSISAADLSFFPFGLLLWIGTIPYIRRHFFKVFLSTHIVGFLGFIIFLQIHYPSSIWYMPGLVFYFMDVAFRMAQWRIMSGVQCTFITANHSVATLRLKFNRVAQVKSSQFLYLNVPSVSWFEWHPISIAAVIPESDNLSQDVVLHLKAYGPWSTGVIKSLAAHGTVNVRVDGPYGYASEPEWAQYDTLILAAGGIGITPLLSMLREVLLHQRQTCTGSDAKQRHYVLPTQVHLIWAVRNEDELQLLDQDLLETAGIVGSWLTLNLYHTSSKDVYVETSPQESGNKNSPQSLKTPEVRNDKIPITSQLQPYGFGDFHWALTHLLAMIGAFFACLLIFAYEYEGSVTSEDGFRIEGIGLLLLLALIIGSMGLPALLIYPFQIIRKHVKACEQAHKHMAHMELSNIESCSESLSPPSPMSPRQAETILPNSKVTSLALDLETGKAATISSGRPDFAALISSIVTSHSQERYIGVVASGPPSLVNDAREAVHLAESTAAKLGIKELAFSSHSFAL